MYEFSCFTCKNAAYECSRAANTPCSHTLETTSRAPDGQPKLQIPSFETKSIGCSPAFFMDRTKVVESYSYNTIDDGRCLGAQGAVANEHRRMHLDFYKATTKRAKILILHRKIQLKKGKRELIKLHESQALQKQYTLNLPKKIVHRVGIPCVNVSS